MFYSNESRSFEWTIDRSLVIDVRCNRSERIKERKFMFQKEFHFTLIDDFYILLTSKS